MDPLEVRLIAQSDRPTVVERDLPVQAHRRVHDDTRPHDATMEEANNNFAGPHGMFIYRGLGASNRWSG